MYTKGSLNKDNLDNCLKELAKEYKKKASHIRAEIVIVGGAAVVANYGFRSMTMDIDAIIQSEVSMKEAINAVGDRLGLSNGWLNSDFKKTTSFSHKLVEHSKYYKTFANILEVRTIKGAYLIAMKLMSGRLYKNDLSDIVGIMKEEKNITLDMIKEACTELYGAYNKIPMSSRTFIDAIFAKEDLDSFYEECSKMEKDNKDILISFNDEYPNAIKKDNVEEIIALAKKRISTKEMEKKNDRK